VADDDLLDFERTTFTFEGKERAVFRKGRGPAVIVISEIPGITPGVATFARRVADRGLTAVMPHVFGVPGKAMSVPYAMQSMGWGCVSKEFASFVTGKTSPVTVWLRALARSEHERCGGPGVGVVGMCFTGGFALAMMVDDTVLAPVLSQPSLPFPLGKSHKRDLGISDDDLARVKERVRDDGVCVLGLRFTNDRAVPAERFQRLREELGDGFIAVEIDSSPGNPYGNPKQAHSVLTENLVDKPGHPTRQALEQVLELFDQRLLHPAQA
jgi:dienelactone hydrolase